MFPLIALMAVSTSCSDANYADELLRTNRRATGTAARGKIAGYPGHSPASCVSAVSCSRKC